MEQMNRKISVGVVWNLVNVLLTRGSSTIFTLFLARLLAPEAFGLIAMIMIVMELSQHFVQSGLDVALIRSKDVSEDDLSTTFYINLGLSVLAYAGVYLAAPLVAEFYSQPDLTMLLRVIGLALFLSAMKVVHIAIIVRAMNFRSLMIANTTSLILSGVVAVTLAWQGAGVWSLVAQSLVASMVQALMLWRITSWVPRLVFSVESFVRLFRFGIHLFINGIINVLVKNSQVIAIGRLFSAELTGLYFFANKLSGGISKPLTGAIQKASFPAMATLQDENKLLLYKYRQIIQMTIFIIAPTMALLIAQAEILFAVLLGDKWLGAVVYMQLLCIVATMYPLHVISQNILNVIGRSDLVLKIGLLRNATSLMILFVAIPYGVFWIVIGQVASSILMLIPSIYLNNRLIDYRINHQLLDMIKPLAAAVVAGIAAFIIIQTVNWPQLALLVLGAISGMVMFLMGSVVFKVEALNMLWSKRRSLLNVTYKDF